MGAAEREGPVQGRLYRSLKLWTFYCDLEESLGTPESTRAAYDRIMELRIATPQIILNYAAFLQVSVFPPVLDPFRLFKKQIFQTRSSSTMLPSFRYRVFPLFLILLDR